MSGSSGSTRIAAAEGRTNRPMHLSLHLHEDHWISATANAPCNAAWRGRDPLPRAAGAHVAASRSSRAAGSRGRGGRREAIKGYDGNPRPVPAGEVGRVPRGLHPRGLVGAAAAETGATRARPGRSATESLRTARGDTRRRWRPVSGKLRCHGVAKRRMARSGGEGENQQWPDTAPNCCCRAISSVRLPRHDRFPPAAASRRAIALATNRRSATTRC